MAREQVRETKQKGSKVTDNDDAPTRSVVIDKMRDIGAPKDVLDWVSALDEEKQGIFASYAEKVHDRLGWSPHAVNEWGMWYLREGDWGSDSAVIDARGRHSIYATHSIEDEPADNDWFFSTMSEWAVALGGDGIDRGKKKKRPERKEN